MLDSLSAPFSGAAASFGDCLIAINKWITVWKPRRYNFTGNGPNTQWWNSPTLTYAALTYAEHDDPPTHPKKKVQLIHVQLQFQWWFCRNHKLAFFKLRQATGILQLHHNAPIAARGCANHEDVGSSSAPLQLKHLRVACNQPRNEALKPPISSDVRESLIFGHFVLRQSKASKVSAWAHTGQIT